MAAKTFPSARDQAIQRVLRHRGSREYFKNGGWTTDPQEADTFSDCVEAAQICARYGLSDVEMALRYDSGGQEVFCTPMR